jgi:hypothetical protein
MVGARLYSGNVEQAARLHAARTSAGYPTARAAAQRFGWAESRYVSHENAKRGIGKAALREYASAFSVSEGWLSDGVADSAPFRDHDVRIDPLRLQQLQLRVEEQSRSSEEPDYARGRRLRLARRLAGFRTAAAGALAAGVHRSTLNGAERGLLGFEVPKARTYAAVFGCEPGWLLAGDLPSGYPPAIEAKLSGLLEDHDRDEADAASRLPPYRPVSRPGRMPKTRPRSPPPQVSGAPLPEYEIQGLVRLLTESEGKARPATLPGWSMPRPFLEEVLRADASGCVLVAVPKEVQADGLAIEAGDRLVVDTSAVDVFSAVYALAHEGVLIVADARTDEGRRLANDASLRRQGMVLIGQIVGTVTTIR